MSASLLYMGFYGVVNNFYNFFYIILVQKTLVQIVKIWSWSKKCNKNNGLVTPLQTVQKAFLD